MPTFFFLLIIITITILFCSPHCLAHNRRVLHQPLFFYTQPSSPPTQPPSLSPSPQLPKFPFSSYTNNIPFFPSVLSPPPPPTLTPTTPTSPSLNTFPANISSLLLPHYPHSKHTSPKLLLVAVIVTVVLVILIVLAFAFFVALRRRRRGGLGKDVDSHRLYPANTAPSDVRQPEAGDGDGGGSGSTLNSSEFLYLGTLVSPRGADNGGGGGSGAGDGSSPYRKLGSPELRPLPPLSRTVYQASYKNANGDSSSSNEEEQQFYSPEVNTERVEIRRSNSSTESKSSSDSASLTSLSSSSSIRPVCLSPESSTRLRSLGSFEQVSGPPVLVAPSGFLKRTPTVHQDVLPWNHVVRAGSGPAMGLEDLKSSKFKLNGDTVGSNQENAILELKKSQNIAVLLRALNMTTEEVCQALLEGNTGSLGTDVLGSLLRMAPTRDEEFKLKEFKNDSLYNLGPAEQFLRAVLDIPFAFKRLDAMLYIANFDSEVEYLRMSFEILKAACEELRNSRMFLKLLEALLNTGNETNVGKNCNNTCAFELDTLLKLFDIKGTDGNTTISHFVAQEITRDEGYYYLSSAGQIPTDEQFSVQDDVEFRKLKWKVIDGIDNELTNVKKAAEIDYEALSNDVSELAHGIRNVSEVVQLNEATSTTESNQRFSASMNKFLKKAEGEIIRIQAQESVAISSVKEITAYFHVNSARKEGDPLRVFRVVSDFLSVLNQVCKEVGKDNGQTLINSPLSVSSSS